MKLKKLKLLGFKSFADEVILNFDASLIALVGPNGCGKSNIVDAFRWVIGEQSAKSMRAGSMQDVIFAGSETRKALNYAEISLTLSEVEGIFSDVTLTRRLHKSGESEYLINKQQARLKDLQRIFLGSGLGKSAFAIFEQGKLDEIVYLNPNERRVIFDEAASISGFLQRKKEAARRLEEVAQNFSRIKDIHAEVDKRLRLLKKQAEEAKKYQEKKERLHHLEKAVFEKKLVKMEEKLQSQLDLKKQLEDEILKKSQSFSSQEGDFQEMRKQLIAKEQEIKALEKKVTELEGAIKTLAHEEKNENAKLLELATQERRILSEKQNSNRSQIKSQIEKNKERLCLIEEQKNQFEDQWKKISDEYSKLMKSLQRLQEEEKKSVKEERKFFEEHAFLDKKLQEKILFKNRFKDDLQALENRIQEDKNKIEELSRKEKEKRQSLKTLLEETDFLKKEAEETGFEFKQLQSALQECEKNLSQFTLEIKKLSIQESTEGFTKGGKALLKEAAESTSDLYGKLKPLCTSIAVASEYVEEVMAFARKKKISGFCLASLEKDVLDIPGVVQKSDFMARSLPEFEPGEAVAEAAQLKQVGRCRQVQRQGEGDAARNRFLNYERYKCLLYFVGEGSEENRIVYLKKVEADLKKFKQELALEQEHRVELLAKKELLEKKRAGLEENWRKKEIASVQENFFLQQILQDMKKSLNAVEKAILDKKRLEERSKEIEKEIQELQEAIQKIQERKKAFEEESSKVQKELVLTLKNQNELQQHRKKADQLFQESFSEYQKIAHEIKILEAKEEWNKGQEKRWEEELLEIGLKKQKAQKAIEEVLLEKESTLKLHSHSLEILKREEVDFKGFVEKQNQMQKDSHLERKNLSILEAKYQQLETALIELQEQKNKFDAEFLERFNEKSHAILEISIEEAEKQLARLRYDLESQALVNMTSIEESKQEEERWSHLDKQLGDLKGAKEDLEKIIKNLDTEARKLFKETFEAIRLNFQKNFALFFNGGKADLKFVGSQDILEAGIDIVAEPKGKAMRSISLLSGGEKCMTALALLFSIFEVKPAPFCILDEVDAPLDDANVERFTSLLGQYRESTQFIIVTHNKKTMAKADRLFGVSMEEKGVSKLISIEFEKRHIMEKVK